MTHANGSQVEKNVLIPMRDGVRLAADLYLPGPGPGEPLPVVMEYIPYRKDEVVPGSRFYEYLPRMDTSSRASTSAARAPPRASNTDEYVLQEQLDGYDAIEWLAAQPFCDGHVNQMGISYGGFTSLQVATHQPPHLTSIIPMYFTDDRYTDDCHYRGGHLRKYYDVGHYGNFMIAYNALPPYPEWSGGDWATIWEEHLERNEPYLLKWLAHQTDGPYWRHGSVRDIADRIVCPVFMIGGWRDGYPNPPLRLYQALNVPKKVLIGPWNHALPDVAIPGPRIDYLREVVRWLDHWCKGEQTGVMDEPPVVVYVQHSEKPVVDRLESAGAWRAETDWPSLRELASATLHLGAGGPLGDRPGEEAADKFEYVPTVGVTGGLWSGGLQFGLPGDQRADEAFSLVYTSAPLDRGRPYHRPPACRPARLLDRNRDRLRRQPLRRRARRELAPGRQRNAECDAPSFVRRRGAADPAGELRARDRDRHDRLGLSRWASDPPRCRERRLAERLADARAGDEHGLLWWATPVTARVADGPTDWQRDAA